MLKYLNTKKYKNKLFIHISHKWAWPKELAKQLAKKFSATIGILF